VWAGVDKWRLTKASMCLNQKLRYYHLSLIIIIFLTEIFKGITAIKMGIIIKGLETDSF